MYLKSRQIYLAHYRPNKMFCRTDQNSCRRMESKMHYTSESPFMQNEKLKVYLEILIINHPPKEKLHKLLATEESTFSVYSSKGHVLFLTQDTSWENGSMNDSTFSLFV